MLTARVAVFLGALSVTIAGHGAIAAAGEGRSAAYVRLGAGAAISSDTAFEDSDCTSTDPAAFFGCGAGSDGRPLGAYGDFGTSALIDFGLGYRVAEWARAEATLSFRPGLGFWGDANFVNVPGDEEQVDSSVDSLSAMLTGYLDLAPVLNLDTAPLNPFISAGIGVAHNETDAMVYMFPTLGAGSATITQPGSSTDLAWSVGAGLDVDAADDSTAVAESYDFQLRPCPLGRFGQVEEDAAHVRVTLERLYEQRRVTAADVRQTTDAAKIEGRQHGVGFGAMDRGYAGVEDGGVFRISGQVIKQWHAEGFVESGFPCPEAAQDLRPGRKEAPGHAGVGSLRAFDTVPQEPAHIRQRVVAVGFREQTEAAKVAEQASKGLRLSASGGGEVV